MSIRQLTPSDSVALQALRLAALGESPSAFHASYDEETDLPIYVTEYQLKAATDRGIFGAFENGVLVGIVALGRESGRKLRRKAFIWSMYISPESRGKGTGRALLAEALRVARSVPELLQVNLAVNASNIPAIRLYESMGFKAFGRETGSLLVDGALYDELHMSFRLDES